MVSRVSNTFSSDTASYLESSEGIIVKSSPSFEKKFGYSEQDLLNKEISCFIDLTSLNNKMSEEPDINFFKTSISTKWGITKESIVIKATIDYDRDLFIFKDNYNHEDLEHLQSSYIDKLTGLQYKHAFNKDLNENELFYIALFEIKNFTNISSFYGDDVADNLVLDIASNLKNSFNINNLFKMDNHTFALIKNSKDIDNIDLFIEDVINKVDGFIYKSNEKYSISKIDYSFAFAEGNGKKIFKRALLALKYCKENHLKKYIFNKDFHIKQRTSYLEEDKSLRRLQNALSNGKIVPFYQPIFYNKENRVTKYECLARLQDENGEFLTPAAFIDVGKKFHLNNDITKAIIDKSFAYFRNKDVDFSINLTCQILHDLDMYSYINNAVNDFSNPHRIIFEVIESEAMPLELFEKNHLIKELRKKGCKFALDDFGSGYSNLSMLTYFNYDYLKIDGSLINNIDKRASYQTIKAIVELAHNHGVEVVAEWVKDENIQRLVRELNIDYSQGYLFGKPEINII